MDTTTCTKISHGQRLSIKLPSLNHGLLSHNFTAGSVRGYAAENGDDVGAWVERAQRLGHSLYYVFNEGFVITARRQEVVERTV